MAERKNNESRSRQTQTRRTPMSEHEVLRNAPSRYRKRRPRSINMALVLLTVLLVATLAASVIHIVRLSGEAIHNHKEHIEEAVNSEKEQMNPEKEEPKLQEIVLSSEEVFRGDLILVNYETPYVFPEDESELVYVSEHKTDDYRVAYPDFRLDSDVVEVFNDFVSDLNEATGERCLLVNSTYRSFEQQQATYDDYVTNHGQAAAEKYVADPGNSEHHTGLAMDLTIMLDDGTYQKMADYEHYGVINTVCVEYGFIHRYPATKENITRISSEPWHYRYVGVPHSYVISKERLCLEEYIVSIKDYTIDGKLKLVDSEGKLGECDLNTLPEVGYVIYYVPGGEGDTVLSIPTEADSYTVSGNNTDGFVVAVTFGEMTLPEISFAIVG